MDFLKKQSSGFYLTVLATLLMSISIISYVINCNTSYYSKYGVDGVIIALGVLSIVSYIIYLFSVNIIGDKKVFDIFPPLSSVFIVISFVLFVSARAGSIGSILTFENNAENLADLTTALIGIIAALLAVIFSIVSSFHKVTK